jgi:hypothetical protein
MRVRQDLLDEGVAHGELSLADALEPFSEQPLASLVIGVVPGRGIDACAEHVLEAFFAHSGDRNSSIPMRMPSTLRPVAPAGKDNRRKGSCQHPSQATPPCGRCPAAA